MTEEDIVLYPPLRGTVQVPFWTPMCMLMRVPDSAIPGDPKHSHIHSQFWTNFQSTRTYSSPSASAAAAAAAASGSSSTSSEEEVVVKELPWSALPLVPLAAPSPSSPSSSTSLSPLFHTAAALVFPSLPGTFEATARVGRGPQSEKSIHTGVGGDMTTTITTTTTAPTWRWLGSFGVNLHIVVTNPTPTTHRLMPPPSPCAARAIADGMAVAARGLLITPLVDTLQSHTQHERKTNTNTRGSAPPPPPPANTTHQQLQQQQTLSSSLSIVQSLLLDIVDINNTTSSAAAGGSSNSSSNNSNASSSSSLASSSSRSGSNTALKPSGSSISRGLGNTTTNSHSSSRNNISATCTATTTTSVSSSSSSFSPFMAALSGVASYSTSHYSTTNDSSSTIGSNNNVYNNIPLTSSGTSETSYIVGLLALLVGHTMSNTPHQSTAHNVALIQMLAVLPGLKSSSMRARILSRILGIDVIAAGVILEDIGRVPVEVLADAVIPIGTCIPNPSSVSSSSLVSSSSSLSSSLAEKRLTASGGTGARAIPMLPSSTTSSSSFPFAGTSAGPAAALGIAGILVFPRTPSPEAEAASGSNQSSTSSSRRGSVGSDLSSSAPQSDVEDENVDNDDVSGSSSKKKSSSSSADSSSALLVASADQPGSLAAVLESLSSPQGMSPVPRSAMTSSSSAVQKTRTLKLVCGDIDDVGFFASAPITQYEMQQLLLKQQSRRHQQQGNSKNIASGSIMYGGGNDNNNHEYEYVDDDDDDDDDEDTLDSNNKQGMMMADIHGPSPLVGVHGGHTNLNHRHSHQRHQQHALGYVSLSSSSSSSSRNLSTRRLRLPSSPTVFYGPIMTVRQRALLTFAKWASGKHWETGDPLQALALDLFLNALAHLSPAYVHGTLVVHVLQTLCCAAPASVVRVYYARALRTLFGKGTPTASSRVTMHRGVGESRRRIPNLARAVVVAVHDIITAHMTDSAVAQGRSRISELPPLVPSAAYKHNLPELAMAVASTPAQASNKHRGGYNSSSSSSPSSSGHNTIKDINIEGGITSSRNSSNNNNSPFLRRSDSGVNFGATGSNVDSSSSTSNPHMYLSSPPRVNQAGYTQSHQDGNSSGGGSLSPSAFPSGIILSPVIVSPTKLAQQSVFTLTCSETRRLDTARSDSEFDLQVLMALVGDLLHESKAATASKKAKAEAIAAATTTNNGRSNGIDTLHPVHATGLALAAKSGADFMGVDAVNHHDGHHHEHAGDDDSGSSGCSELSCASCGGDCALRSSTLNHARSEEEQEEVETYTKKREEKKTPISTASVSAVAIPSASSPSSSSSSAIDEVSKEVDLSIHLSPRSSMTEATHPSTILSTSSSSDRTSRFQVQQQQHPVAPNMEEAFSVRSPHVSQPYSHVADTSASGIAVKKGVVGEITTATTSELNNHVTSSITTAATAPLSSTTSTTISSSYSSPAPPPLLRKNTPPLNVILADAAAASAASFLSVSPPRSQQEEILASPSSSSSLSFIPASLSTPKSFLRPIVRAMCPSSDSGTGASLGLWIEVARAVATAAVRLSSVPDGGDGITPEYKSVLTCALQLSHACPLLREVVLRRILRKWPVGNSENEVALLEFLATLLVHITNRGDLTATELQASLLTRVCRSLSSPHIKVARNALLLTDPTRRLLEFVIEDPKNLGVLVNTLNNNAVKHWNTMVRRASAAAAAVYGEHLALLLGYSNTDEYNAATNAAAAASASAIADIAKQANLLPMSPPPAPLSPNIVTVSTSTPNDVATKRDVVRPTTTSSSMTKTTAIRSNNTIRSGYSSSSSPVESVGLVYE